MDLEQALKEQLTSCRNDFLTKKQLLTAFYNIRLSMTIELPVISKSIDKILAAITSNKIEK